MDPQATWNLLQDAIRDGDAETARELAQALIDWLERGGFPPVISEAEDQHTAQHGAIALRFCRTVLESPHR